MQSLPRVLLRRLVEVVPLLFGLVTLTFFLSRLLPGDVTTLFLSPRVPPDVADQLRQQFGLDRSPAEQYLFWLRAVFRGDLGYSFTHNSPVTAVLGAVFPNTLLLGVTALLLEILIAVGLASAVLSGPGSHLDRFVSSGTLVIYSLPSFWVGLVLLMVFAYGFGLLPSSHMHSVAGDWSGGLGSLTDLARHLVLPALTIAIPGGAGLARYLRTHITSTLNQEFVTAARSMGLSKKKIFTSYVLPNSISPLVSLLGIEFGGLLSGVVVTETLFAWPGMGRVVVQSIFARDYPLVLGCTIVACLVVVVGNIMAELVHAMIDPRIRLAA